MSADLVSLPFLHEPKVSTAPRALMVCYWCVILASLLRRVRSKSPRALALKGLAPKRDYRSISRLCGSAIKGTIKVIQDLQTQTPCTLYHLLCEFNYHLFN